MTVNTFTFDEAVDLVNRQFSVLSEKLFESPVETVFKVEEKPYMSGNTIRYSEFDGEEYADNKAEGDAASIADFTVGYYKDLTIKTVAKHVKITHEMRKQNRYSDIARRINDI